jgi:TolA-binding protein
LVTGSVGAQQPEIRRAIPVAPAQPIGEEPEIRRAEPVTPREIENPAWMDSLPVRPAEPVTPIPIPTPQPTPDQGYQPPRTTPAPVDPQPSEPRRPQTARPELRDEAGSIRLGPSAETEDQSLLAANGFYRREMYDMAVYEYERFLIAQPQAEGRDGAMFRLAESHRFLGNSDAARTGYQRLLEQFRDGEFVGSGAYRLAEIYYGENNFGAAVELFRTARDNSESEAIKLSATFYEANALNALDKKAEALAVFRKLAEKRTDNPYRDAADFYIAESLSKAGAKAEALDVYARLGDEAEKADLQAEATVKAAAIAAELGRDEEARKLFTKALAKPAIGDWRGVAKLGAIRLAYEAGEFAEPAALTTAEIAELPQEAIPEAMLISANAKRQLGEKEGAIALYEQILAEYPDSDAAGSALFQRLVSLDQTDGADLLVQVDDFLAKSTDPRERGRAFLLKAETLFKMGEYAKAAEFYNRALASKLPERQLEQALFKLGWCLAQTKDWVAARQTFGKFIDTYPTSDLFASALAQRATAAQQAQAYDEAMTDFQRLIDEFPQAPERELALQQMALTLGQQEKFDEMSAAFERLLEEYPETKAAGQAEYWIGWSLFEKKEYDAAIGHLERARELDPEQFGDRGTVRIILAHFYQEDRAAVAAEAEKATPGVVPSDVMIWLGNQFFDEGDYAKAEAFLAPLAERDPSIPVSPEVLISLVEARLAQSKYDAAKGPVERYLAEARDPVSRARALLAQGEIALGKGEPVEAERLAEEALLLQPEGKYNAAGRMLMGDIQMTNGEFDGAARSFLTIAVLYDDPKMTPRALRRAAAAYERAGNATEAEKALAELEQRYPAAEAGAASE